MEWKCVCKNTLPIENLKQLYNYFPEILSNLRRAATVEIHKCMSFIIILLNTLLENAAKGTIEVHSQHLQFALMKFK
jgi:hypothetical protein